MISYYIFWEKWADDDFNPGGILCGQTLWPGELVCSFVLYFWLLTSDPNEYTLGPHPNEEECNKYLRASCGHGSWTFFHDTVLCNVSQKHPQICLPGPDIRSLWIHSWDAYFNRRWSALYPSLSKIQSRVSAPSLFIIQYHLCWLSSYTLSFYHVFITSVPLSLSNNWIVVLKTFSLCICEYRWIFSDNSTSSFV